jgi:hypothetical protein
LKKVASNVNTSKRAKFLQMEKQNPNDAFVQFAKFASGGSAVGSDSIPAMLTPGEWVVKKPAVDKYGLGLMNAINTMSMPREILERMATPPRVARFATGGPVGGDRSAPSSSSYKGSQTGGINLTINAPSGDADAIARAVLPAINRIQGRSR